MTVPTPEYGGCPWPVDAACFTTEWESLDATVQERSLALASSTLARLTGYRVSNCPITVRPCKPNDAWVGGHPFPFYTGVPFTPSITRTGAWVNNGCCSLASCECTVTCEVRLPAPVGRVDEVKVDGAVVPSTDYRVDGNLLVYTGSGECPWPATQDLSKSDTETGTFSVTYLNAYPVDSLGAYAAGVLAMEYAKACSGSKCRLPLGVTQVARQGITMEIASGAFPNGLTGIREVDAFIALWNPDGLQRQSSVWSPDLNRFRIGGTA